MNGNHVLAKARAEGRVFLTEIESKEIIRGLGIPTTEIKLATTREQAVAQAKEIGLPVVLKVVSQDIIHKTDVGGVKVGLATEGEVGKAYDDIVASVKANAPNATVGGIAVQNMVKPGTEVIIGMTKDPQFGPVLMFGLGGIMVEVLKDVAFRIVPLTRRDAQQMIREIKGFPLLEGYRGQEPANVAALEDILMKLSDFVDQHSEIKEVDLNPIFARSNGAVAVDARIILEES